MTDYIDLIARLPEAMHRLRSVGSFESAQDVSDAADAIEALLAERVALRRIVAYAKEMRAVVLPVDREDDEVLERFDAAMKEPTAAQVLGNDLWSGCKP